MDVHSQFNTPKKYKMKKKIMIFLLLNIMILVSINLGFAQHPLGETQILIGNGYFKPHNQKGDGSWRYFEARIIPNQRSSLRAGLYLSATEVASKIANFKHHSTEYGVGLAFNKNFQPGWKYDKYGWLNIAYKQSRANGSIRLPTGFFENNQKDHLLYLAGGIIFSNSLETFPLVRQKLAIDYQRVLEAENNGTWDKKNIISQPWKNDRIRVDFENALAKLNLSWQREIYLLPAIYLGYSHENGKSQDFGALGAVLTLAKGEYGKEILNLSYQAKFDLKGKERIDLFQINLNVISFLRKSEH